MTTLTRAKVEAVAADLDALADHADDVTMAQAAAGFSNDSAVTYWQGAKVAYRAAAKLVREKLK